MTRYVIGDLHANYLGMIQALERSNFDYDNDELICLGDVVDGYPDSYEVLEELLKIKNLIMIAGNHDAWALDYFTKGTLAYIHMSQGGQSTVDSYVKHGKIPQSHIDLLQYAHKYYIDDDNNLFVHGGFDYWRHLRTHTPHELMWNRSLSEYAYQCHHTKSCDIPKPLQKYNNIFIGHTTTERYGTTEPLHLCNVFMLDTGAGYNSKVTIMNIDTKEYFQSNNADELYGPNQGR